MVNMDEYLTGNFVIKIFGWIVVAIILFTTAILNGKNLTKPPLYAFAGITLLIMIFLPKLVNKDCEGSGSDYYCLGEITDDIPDYDESEKLGISLGRSFAGVVSTLIYFGFVTRAIAKYHKVEGSFKGGSAGASESYRDLSIALAEFGPLSTMVYMAIIIIIINVIGNLYIYFNLEDKDEGSKRFYLRAFVLAQYNIVLITVIGLVVLFASAPINAQ